MAYYKSLGDTLADTLYVSLQERAGGGWTHASIARVRWAPGDTTSYTLGTALRITLSGDHVFVDTHLNPSAGTLLVLTRALVPLATLKGWSELLLPNGSVVYQKNTVHFAPTHPAELHLFDPHTGRNAAVYPTQPYAAVRRAYIERVREIYERLGDEWFRLNNHHMMAEQFESRIGTPQADSLGRRVAFIARFGEGGGSRAATPLVEVLVVCSNLAFTAQCMEQELSATRLARPGLSDEQMVREALLRGG
jgi:hypothetical protein